MPIGEIPGVCLQPHNNANKFSNYITFKAPLDNAAPSSAALSPPIAMGKQLETACGGPWDEERQKLAQKWENTNQLNLYGWSH